MKESDDLETRVINRIKHECPDIDTDTVMIPWRDVMHALCEQQTACEHRLASALEEQEAVHDATKRVLRDMLSTLHKQKDAHAAEVAALKDELAQYPF